MRKLLSHLVRNYTDITASVTQDNLSPRTKTRSVDTIQTYYFIQLTYSFTYKIQLWRDFSIRVSECNLFFIIFSCFPKTCLGIPAIECLLQCIVFKRRPFIEIRTFSSKNLFFNLFSERIVIDILNFLISSF